MAQWRSLLVTLGIVMLAALPVIYFVVGGWTSRILQLVRFAEHITNGDYTREIQYHKNDELGQLVSAYEHMRLAIKDRELVEQRRSDELRIAREEADKANEAKSQFLAHMSHEIRTPINGVTGMLELLSMTQLNEKQRKQIRTAMSSADALLSLINDILDFSKIEAGHMEAEHIPVDVHDVFESVAEMLACKAADKGVELICDIAKGVPRYVLSDPTKLRQIGINLVNNAIKFTEQGEVVIRISAQEQQDGTWLLRGSVSDTGIGIPPNQRDRLFKSFSQVDATTTRKFGGTGLGLAISKGFIELMGGEIGINPERTEGSEFWFTFRAGQCDQEYEQRPVFHGVLTGMRSIIIDDNETNRDIYTDALTAWGLRPEAFERGEDALVAMREASNLEDPFKLAILDMQMPEMDGVMLAEAIQSDPAIHKPTMVMLTSMYHTADSDDFENLSLAACLQKPVRLSTLQDALAQYLAGSVTHQVESHDDHADLLESLRGKEILVAEDNSVNQMVIGELLRSVGVQAKIVENGAQAVTEACGHDFDIVLMDCSMPEMDGFEATQWIREQEKSMRSKDRTIIIALTANAIQGDRERRIDAGMDDYLTKPINAKRLFETLAKWIHKASVNTPEDSQADANAAQNRPALPPTPTETQQQQSHRTQAGDIFDIDAALERCAGNPRVLAMVLDEFTRSYDGITPVLEGLIESADYDQIAHQAHALKGAASNIGAAELAGYASGLETAAREQQLQQAQRTVSAISESLAQLTQQIEAVRPNIDGEHA